MLSYQIFWSISLNIRLSYRNVTELERVKHVLYLFYSKFYEGMAEHSETIGWNPIVRITKGTGNLLSL